MLTLLEVVTSGHESVRGVKESLMASKENCDKKSTRLIVDINM